MVRELRVQRGVFLRMTKRSLKSTRHESCSILAQRHGEAVSVAYSMAHGRLDLERAEPGMV